MKLALTVLFLVFALAGGSGKAFFHKRKAPRPPPADYFEKLGLVRPGNRVPAPDFSLEDLSGQRFRLEGLRGKVVFLNFWATWCGPCRLEMPTMERLHREFHGQGLEVLAVNIRESREAVRRFVDEFGLSFTVLLDKDGEVMEEYGAWAIPLTYIIDQKGEFVAKAVGYREWDRREALAFFSGLLADKAQVDAGDR